MDRIFKIDKQLCGKFHATYVEKVDEKHLVMHFDCPIVKRMTWDLITDAIDLYAWGLSWSSWLEKEARYHFNLAHLVLCKDPYHDLKKTLEEMYNEGKIFHKLIDIRTQGYDEIIGNRICLVFGPEQPGHYAPFIQYTPNDFLGHEYFNVGTFYRYNEMGISVTHYCGPHRLFGNEEFVNIFIAIQDFYMNTTEI